MNRVILYLGEQDEWVAECMNPACAGRAKTKEKALEHVKRAIQLTGQLERANGIDLPYDASAVTLSIYEIRSRPSTAHLN